MNNIGVYSDEYFMKEALALAKASADGGEVPVGAVIVKNGVVIASAANTRETLGDATGHAEINAIKQACAYLGGWHLDGCTLYVTLEPCPMCMGAIINSRIERVVFGAKDANAGACGSVISLASYPFNHKPRIDGGLLCRECADMLSEFFGQKRRLK